MTNEARKLIEMIKEIASDTIESNKLSDVFYGTVINILPLSIKINEKLTLPESVLVLHSSVKEKIIIIGEVDYTINSGLQINDKVMLLRTQNGQQFIIIDKV